MAKSIASPFGNASCHGGLSRTAERTRCPPPGPIYHRRDAEAQLQRLAAELHDRVAQSLWGLDLTLGQLRDLILRDPGEASQQLAPAHELIVEAYHDVRLAIGALRDSPPVQASLEKALRSSLESFTHRTGIENDLTFDSPPASLSKLVELQLHAILHQALVNVRKHSGASRVAVTFSETADGWNLIIVDNGRGLADGDSFDTDGPSHFGLTIMRERAQSFGGSVSVASRQGEGVSVEVLIPRSAAARPRCHARRRTLSGGYRGRPAAHRR